MQAWIRELLDIGMGRIAIQTLALLDAGITNQSKPMKCVCGTIIRKWAVACPKCRRIL